MTEKKYDIIIIGAGPGGYRAACHAAAAKLSVAIVEAVEAGGTCLNRGCIPTKALCHEAETIEQARLFKDIGNDEPTFNIDIQAIRKKVDGVVAQLRSGIETLLSQPNISLIKGHAHFAGDHSIRVGEAILTAENIIIATGSSPKSLNIQGERLEGVLNSNSILALDSIPSELCIVGAGVVGMEFASIFNAFGSKVTVVEYLKEALPTLDSDIAKRLRQSMSRKGITFHTQSKVVKITESSNSDGASKLELTFEKKGTETTVSADNILIATGRKANIEGLGIENTSIAHNNGTIDVDDDFRTSVNGVWAIGDVNGITMLAHAAEAQAKHVVNSILGLDDNIRFDIMPSAVFTLPQAAAVGPSEAELKADGTAYECRKQYYRSNGRAVAEGRAEGMVKLFTESSTGRLLGCHAFGAESAAIVQEVAAMMNLNATIGDIRDIIHIHPTISEVLAEAANS